MIPVAARHAVVLQAEWVMMRATEKRNPSAAGATQELKPDDRGGNPPPVISTRCAHFT